MPSSSLDSLKSIGDVFLLAGQNLMVGNPLIGTSGTSFTVASILAMTIFLLKASFFAAFSYFGSNYLQ
jgi:hypothetical protein